MNSTGLVCAGGVSRSFIARLPELLSTVGPVKAASFRVARRIVNSLRAGYAVEHYNELSACRVIWVAVPDSMLERVTRDLAAHAQLQGKMVVLCGCECDSLWPGPLRTASARVASFNALDESDEPALVAEGHPDVIRELRRLAATEKRKLIEIRPGSKAFFFAGVHLGTHLFLPWIAAAVESLRAAGFTRTEATRVVESMGARTLRAYGKAGRKAWSRAASGDLRRAFDRDLKTIRAVDPRLAALYAEGIDTALRYFDEASGSAGSGRS